jgi:isocitrate/isopropylmalate dehydrogenase
VRGAAAVDDAIAAIVARGNPLTGDLVGKAGTKAVAQAVRDEVHRRLSC